jgi:type I restriction enzyme, S subunit
MKALWKSCTIQDLQDKGEAELKTGPFGTQLHASDYVDEGTPVINVRNISFGNIREEKLEFISDHTVQRLSSHLLLPGDIVFGRKGAVERHVFIREEQSGWLQGSDCLRLRIKGSSIEPRFLSYYFLTEAHQQWMMNQCSHGSTMASLNQAIISRIPLFIPPIEIQHRILDFLSTYDRLIENNTRRIKILEEMAQLLYREWFVNFRFPGHQQVPMVESAIGLIPKGWDVAAIGDVIDTLSGGTPSTKNSEYWEGGNIEWFSPSDLTEAGTMFITQSSKKITMLGLKKSSAKLFPAYSVMMTSRATIGVIAINTKEACTNQGLITCIPNEKISMHQIYYWLIENRGKITTLASGATFKEINKTTFRQLPIVIPTTLIQNKFAEIAQPIFQQIENLQKKNLNLRKTRDLLLPKLISGEIDVESFESAIESDMEELAA